MTEKLITAQPLSQEEREAIEKSVDEALGGILLDLQKYPLENLIAVAGTPSALAAAEIGFFDADRVHGFLLDQNLLKKWCDILANTSVQEKIEKYKIDSGRADVLFVGATLLHRLLLKLKKPSLMVSIKGVRYGVALEVLRR